MGFNDRDYAREATRQSMPRLPIVTKSLLILNLGIFLLDMFQRPKGLPPEALAWGPLNRWGCFTVESGILQGRFWEFLTFQFLHDSVGHVLFNCIGIFFFGPFVERWWGTKRFIGYYLLCGAGGGLFYSLLLAIGLLPNADIGTPLVGASAGVFGLIFAVYRLAPAVRVQLLFPPIELTMRQLAMVLAGLALLMIAGGLVFSDAKIFGNSGGEAGHLGGALMGLFLMHFPILLGKPDGLSGKVIRPRQFRRRKRDGTQPGRQTVVDFEQVNAVDRILDKIAVEGVANLTEEERRILQEASRKP